MKNILLTITLALTCYFSYAQTNAFPSSGNVGIGTTSPSVPLHVLKTGAFVTGNWYNIAQFRDGAQNKGIDLGYDNSSQTGIITTGSNAAASNLAFWTYNGASWGERMRLDNSGNVGIGTTTPAEILTLRNPAITYNSGTGVEKLFFDSGAGGGGIGFEKETFNTGGLRFYTQYGYGSTVEKMRITSYGNVLIGQTSQANTVYILDIAGPARANEVVVNTTGADFVFKPTYHLLPLKSVANYINQNHHLPEIQSAAEMQKGGLNLGENQTKLLQKVEELTLYIIQQNKRIEKLEKELNHKK